MHYFWQMVLMHLGDTPYIVFVDDVMWLSRFWLPALEPNMIVTI